MIKVQIVMAYIMLILSWAMFVVFAMQGEKLSIVFLALADLYSGRANDLRGICEIKEYISDNIMCDSTCGRTDVCVSDKSNRNTTKRRNRKI